MTSPATDHPELTAALDNALRKARVAYGVVAIFALVVVQVGVRIALQDDWEPPLADEGEPLWVLRAVLAALVVVDVFVVGLVRRKTLSSDRPVTSGIVRIDAPPPLQRLFTVSLVTGLLTEAVAVYGLLLTLAGGEIWDVAVFGVAALIGFAITFPRRGAWEEYARSVAAQGGTPLHAP